MEEITLNIYIGTSGYGYKEWKGKFYPLDLPAKQMLKFYGTQFSTVEINNTFYRMPAPAQLLSWRNEVPADFRFSIKAPQLITHRLKLQDAGKPLSQFHKAVDALQERLGSLFFQLPPYFQKDHARLRDFLKLRRTTDHWAFEFRHQSWFDAEVFNLLNENNSALCLAEADDTLEVPVVATADFGYVRLRRADYPDPALKIWAKRVLAQKWKDVFIFFKHEDEAKGPEAAHRFLKIINQLKH